MFQPPIFGQVLEVSRNCVEETHTNGRLRRSPPRSLQPRLHPESLPAISLVQVCAGDIHPGVRR